MEDGLKYIKLSYMPWSLSGVGKSTEEKKYIYT